MKRTTLIIMAVLFLAVQAAVAVPEFTRVPELTDDHKRVIAGLERDIAGVQDKINIYFGSLPEYDPQDQESIYDDGCRLLYGGHKIFCDYFAINKETNETYIPMRNERETHYGSRDRHVNSEMARIKWQDGKAIRFTFETRRALMGTIEILHKKLWGNSIAGARDETGVQVAQNAGAPVNLVVNEILSQGQGIYANFRFPDPDATEVTRDEVMEVEIDGEMTTIPVVYLRDPEKRILVIREYLRMLRRVEMRLDWHVRSREWRKSQQIERVFRRHEDF